VSALLDRLYAPQWAGGWTAARWLFVLSAFLTQIPRAAGMGDAYGVDDLVFSNPPFHLSDYWIPSLTSAWGLWGLSLVGLGMLAWGGRLAKPGMVTWLVFSWLLLASEALNIKAYDRLLTWIAVGLLLGPIGERGLTEKARSPYGRWFLLLAYYALYGSTGWLKLLREFEGWYSGEVLAYHLVHQHFGLQPIGVWLSDKAPLVAVMSWFTVIFEASFPFLVWSRRASPWLLLAGIGLHAGIYLTMNVGPFSFVALIAYPVLLHPEAARSLCARARRRMGSWWPTHSTHSVVSQANETPSP
jgi:hypothetical protein